MMYEYIQQNVCIPEATGATTCQYKNMNEVHFLSNPLLLWTLALPFQFSGTICAELVLFLS